MTEQPHEPSPSAGDDGVRRADERDPEQLIAALEDAVDYRGDITLTMRGDDDPIVGYIYDRSDDAVRLLPADGGATISVLSQDIVSIAFTGRDTAAGKSFETWIRNFSQRSAEASADPGATDHDESIGA